MITIFEGADGSGKSTLAARYADFVGITVTHFSKPRSQKEKDEMFAMYAESINTNTYQVWDRSFYSELVYGPVMRGQSFISLQEMKILESMLPPKSKVFLCNTSIDTLWDRCIKRGESYITNKKLLHTIQDYYLDLFYNNQHNIKIRYIDTSESDEEILKKLRRN